MHNKDINDALILLLKRIPFCVEFDCNIIWHQSEVIQIIMY